MHVCTYVWVYSSSNNDKSFRIYSATIISLHTPCLYAGDSWQTQFRTPFMFFCFHQRRRRKRRKSEAELHFSPPLAACEISGRGEEELKNYAGGREAMGETNEPLSLLLLLHRQKSGEDVQRWASPARFFSAAAIFAPSFSAVVRV